MTPHLSYPRLSLPQMLGQTARKHAGQTALVYHGAAISYAELSDQASRVAGGLRALGVKQGDRVALLLPNCPQFVIAYFGALRAGAIVTATSALYTAREASHQWRDAGATIVIADRRLLHVVAAARPEVPSLRRVIVTGITDYSPKNWGRLRRKLAIRAPGRKLAAASKALDSAPGARLKPIPWLDLLRHPPGRPPPLPEPSEVACLQYTGGTTGTSKGAMLTHANLVTNAWQTCHRLTGKKFTQDTLVAALPLFHIYAMTCVMISAVLLGGTVIILPRFELKTALNVIRKYRPTIFHGVPTMFVAFSHAPHVERYGFPSLRTCMSGGAPLPREVQQKFEALTGGRLVEGYGLTEASPVTHINPIDGTAPPGSIGRPLPDTEVRIVDLPTGRHELPVGEVGEVIIRGPQVMKGYWNKPEETASQLRDGWLFTGDIGKRDADGYFYIVDRKKDLIIAGGFNIYPREVEEVLFEHPRIKEAVVIGAPDEYRGETVKAVVVVKDGLALTGDEVIAFCRERLAAYKVPRLVEFRAALPKSGVGKYLRRELREGK
ncbi:MAG: long-chain fatty acid--CoA ligase [Verrucomicrobia bacterium]|nr:long-chain fatty acid--CoA ligase [Verrucomicrobiota bacterium]